MSILEAARNDVAMAIRQRMEMNCFIDGLASGGRGLTAVQRQQKSHKAERKRAAAFGSHTNTIVLRPTIGKESSN
jgi:hypothetical protein